MDLSIESTCIPCSASACRWTPQLARGVPNLSIGLPIDDRPPTHRLEHGLLLNGSVALDRAAFTGGD